MEHEQEQPGWRPSPESVSVLIADSEIGRLGGVEAEAERACGGGFRAEEAVEELAAGAFGGGDGEAPVGEGVDEAFAGAGVDEVEVDGSGNGGSGTAEEDDGFGELFGFNAGVGAGGGAVADVEGGGDGSGGSVVEDARFAGLPVVRAGAGGGIPPATVEGLKRDDRDVASEFVVPVEEDTGAVQADEQAPGAVAVASVVDVAAVHFGHGDADSEFATGRRLVVGTGVAVFQGEKVCHDQRQRQREGKE